MGVFWLFLSDVFNTKTQDAPQVKTTFCEIKPVLLLFHLFQTASHFTLFRTSGMDFETILTLRLAPHQLNSKALNWWQREINSA